MAEVQGVVVVVPYIDNNNNDALPPHARAEAHRILAGANPTRCTVCGGVKP